MRITILCSSESHPVNAYLERWILKHQHQHHIDLVRSKTELTQGELLFLISCSEIVEEQDRLPYKTALVIHASDLPRGRGWSPHVWQIINGATNIPVTLLEAEDKVDSGAIWHQISVVIPKDALWDEINHLIFSAEMDLMDFAVENFAAVIPISQSEMVEPSYYPKRNPVDSKIDPTMSLEKQFDLIRVCDPERYPAYFELHGKRYIIRIEKA